jgi:2-keto-4-pentenoate hydratase
MHPADSAEQDIAAKFVAARGAGASLAAFPGVIPATLADAYRVQDAGIARVNDTVGGWKVGRILPPQSTQFGADRLAGPIFSRSIQHAAAGISSTGSIYAGGFGAAEAELLLRLGRVPAPGQTQFTLEEAAALIDSVHVGLEIASSPLATINELGPPVIISDFGNNNGLIIGPEIANWASGNIADLPVAMLIDGVQVGRGSAAVFTDGPVGSVRFLLELMAQRGIDLAPGTWISSGAITGVHDVKVGQRVEARFGDTLSIGCTISHMPQNASAARPNA